MKKIPVVACANSRLHADVMLIRLRRAGVECSSISAFFPHGSMPNSVACWLPVSKKEPMHVGSETIVPAGKSSDRHAGADAREMIASLIKSGIDRPSALSLEEKLEQGHILISVSAANEAEASIAWHIFKHASAEAIVVGGGSLSAKRVAHDEEFATLPPLVAVAA